MEISLRLQADFTEAEVARFTSYAIPQTIPPTHFHRAPGPDPKVSAYDFRTHQTATAILMCLSVLWVNLEVSNPKPTFSPIPFGVQIRNQNPRLYRDIPNSSYSHPGNASPSASPVPVPAHTLSCTILPLGVGLQVYNQRAHQGTASLPMPPIRTLKSNLNPNPNL